MNLTIAISDLAAARKLLTRIHFERLKLPVLTHILATVDAAGLSLAVTDLDHWLETRLPAVIDPFAPARFLIPAEALKAAAAGDKRSRAHFAFQAADDGGATLTLTVPRGGMNTVTVHRTLPADEFPARPSVGGRVGRLSKEVFAALATVAGCASTDSTRYVLNGVLFSPDNGGLLVATDGRRLAVAPAGFTGPSLVLPNAAAHVLLHPDFAARDASLRRTEEGTDKPPMAEFRSGPHTLIAKEIEGSYPDYRQVVPTHFLAEATVPESHRPALIAWLRSIAGDRLSVRLGWDEPGLLTLERLDADGNTATLRVPVAVTGTPPTIAFDPAYLASALEIGPVLRLIDHMSPGLAYAPATGAFCVLMPMRCSVSATAVRPAEIPARAGAVAA